MRLTVPRQSAIIARRGPKKGRHMRRREFIAELSSAAVLTLVSGAVVTFSPVARAQQSPVVHRVGYLGSTQIPYLIEALHSGLRKLGYVEGKNLKVEYRFGGSGSES